MILKTNVGDIQDTTDLRGSFMAGSVILHNATGFLFFSQNDYYQSAVQKARVKIVVGLACRTPTRQPIRARFHNLQLNNLHVKYEQITTLQVKGVYKSPN